MQTKDISEAGDQNKISDLSLFEGDLINKIFAKIGIGSKSTSDLLARMLVIIGITWLPMALFSIGIDLPANARPELNFFYDFAAYAQFLIGIPLFIIAERVISDGIREAGRDIEGSGVIPNENRLELIEIENDIARLRRKNLPEIICFIVAFILSLMTIGPELFWKSDMQTWHVLKSAGGERYFTLPGAWEMLVALPIQIFWWVRWVWKIMLWYWYLSRVSKFKLVLVASHPDHTGGIGFLSEVQAKFALVILAYGISNVVATVGYKIIVEHAPLDMPPVWGPLVGFAIIAPLLFLSPLLLFTKQLSRTKKRALSQFREKAMISALKLENQWLDTPFDEEKESVARTELSQLNLLTGFYERINAMRVVPFDLRSAMQLIGSALGPMLPLIPYFIEMPEPWQKILEAMTKWLPH